MEKITYSGLVHGTGIAEAEGIKASGFRVSCPDPHASDEDQKHCYFGSGVYFYAGDDCEQLAIDYAIKRGRIGVATVHALAELDEPCCCDYNEDWQVIFDQAFAIHGDLGKRKVGSLRVVCNWIAQFHDVRLFRFPDGKLMVNPNPSHYIVVARCPEHLDIVEVKEHEGRVQND